MPGAATAVDGAAAAAAAAAVAAAVEGASCKPLTARLSWPPGRPRRSLNWYLSDRATREDRGFVLSYVLQRLCWAIFSYG